MIQIFSSFSKDTIINMQNGKKTIKLGGPAFFAKNVFEKSDVKYDLRAGKIIETELLVKKNKASGKIKNKVYSKIIKPSYLNLSTKLILLTPILNEWILDQNAKKYPPIFLDIQGYVRYAKENPSIYKKIFWSYIDCIKGTRNEIEKIPKEIINRQKKKTLIITDDIKGVTILNNGRLTSLMPRRIVKQTNTIGAGDTFFANFILEYSKNAKIIECTKYAMKQTEKFLTNKSS